MRSRDAACLHILLALSSSAHSILTILWLSDLLLTPRLFLVVRFSRLNSTLRHLAAPPLSSQWQSPRASNHRFERSLHQACQGKQTCWCSEALASCDIRDERSGKRRRRVNMKEETATVVKEWQNSGSRLPWATKKSLRPLHRSRSTSFEMKDDNVSDSPVWSLINFIYCCINGLRLRLRPPDAMKIGDGKYRGAEVHLPTEILSLIATFIASTYEWGNQRSLWACCLVSQAWYAACITHLYHRPRLGVRNFGMFARTVCPALNVRRARVGVEDMIKILDMRQIAYESSNSLTSRLLNRTKSSLECFVPPAVTFS